MTDSTLDLITLIQNQNFLYLITLWILQNAIRVTRRGDNYDAVVTFNLSSDKRRRYLLFL